MEAGSMDMGSLSIIIYVEGTDIYHFSLECGIVNTTPLPRDFTDGPWTLRIRSEPSVEAILDFDDPLWRLMVFVIAQSHCATV